MANEEHLRILEEGVEAWNAWRKDKPHVEPDLQGAALSRADLNDANLADANLQETDLRRAKLRGAELPMANLQGAYLAQADLTQADFRYPKSLECIHLHGATLDRTRIPRQELGGAVGEERHRHWRAAKEAYLGLKNNWEQLGRYEDANWAYIRERHMEKKTKAPWHCRFYYGHERPFPDDVRSFLSRRWSAVKDFRYRSLPGWSPLVWWFWLKYTAKWGADWLVECLCCYGERMWPVLVWMTISLFTFAFYYWRVEGIRVVDTVSGSVSPACSFRQCLIYSAGAMTTTGFARFQAANDGIRIATALQAMMGIALTGLLGFVAGNRIRRS